MTRWPCGGPRPSVQLLKLPVSEINREKSLFPPRTVGRPVTETVCGSSCLPLSGPTQAPKGPQGSPEASRSPNHCRYPQSQRSPHAVTDRPPHRHTARPTTAPQRPSAWAPTTHAGLQAAAQVPVRPPSAGAPAPLPHHSLLGVQRTVPGFRTERQPLRASPHSPGTAQSSSGSLPALPRWAPPAPARNPPLTFPPRLAPGWTPQHEALGPAFWGCPPASWTAPCRRAPACSSNHTPLVFSVSGNRTGRASRQDKPVVPGAASRPLAPTATASAQTRTRLLTRALPRPSGGLLVQPLGPVLASEHQLATQQPQPVL